MTSAQTSTVLSFCFSLGYSIASGAFKASNTAWKRQGIRNFGGKYIITMQSPLSKATDWYHTSRRNKARYMFKIAVKSKQTSSSREGQSWAKNRVDLKCFKRTKACSKGKVRTKIKSPHKWRATFLANAG